MVCHWRLHSWSQKRDSLVVSDRGSEKQINLFGDWQSGIAKWYKYLTINNINNFVVVACNPRRDSVFINFLDLAQNESQIFELALIIDLS